MEAERLVGSQIRLFKYDEFKLVCHVAFVGLILCGVEIFPRHYDEDPMVRWPAFLGDHPRPNYVHRSWFPFFFMGDSRGFQKFLLGTFNFMWVNERVVSLLRSNWSIFTEVLAVFCLANIDTTEKMSLKFHCNS